MRGRRQERGFTYIELMAAFTIVTALALVTFPYLHTKYRLMKEMELKRGLQTMRDAIDHYHELARTGQIEPWDLDWMMYPEDLDMLVEGVMVKPAADKEPMLVKFLRKVPVDPMTGEATWRCRAYDDDPDDFSSSCDTLYDVSSESSDQALDGTYYSDW